MKLKLKKIVIIVIVFITYQNIVILNVNAANYTANYKNYTTPSSSDYAYWNGSKVVKSAGTTVPEIKWMQATLNYVIAYKGISASKLDVDGSYGPLTRKACLAFQKKYRLSQDGSFGKNTIAKMKNVLAQKSTSITTKTKIENDVEYTYATVTLNTSSMDSWLKSVKNVENELCNSKKGVIVAANVISKKNVSWKVPKAAIYQGPRITGNVSVKYKIPSKVQYKLHKHKRNYGYGVSVYLTSTSVKTIYTCNCGYRKEIMEWVIPLPDFSKFSDAQTTKSVIQWLPQIKK